MRIGQVDVTEVAKETAREFIDDDITGMAAETAFRLIFALPPLLIFFISLSALVDRYTGVDVFGELLALAEETLPGQVMGTVDLMVQGIEEQAGIGALLSFGFLIAIWSASNAVDTMMKGFNRAYEVDEPRGFVKRKAVAIGLTIGLSLFIITSFVLFVFGERLGALVADWAGLGPTFELVWNILRFPILIVLFGIALAILYWAGPAVEQSFRWISPGSVIATLLWLVATFGFSLYLRFADPGGAYGALGTLVVLLFFLYVSSIILLLGAEVNAVMAIRYDPRTVADKAAHPERQTESPEAAHHRAEAYAAREGKSPEEVGVDAESRRRAEHEQRARSRPRDDAMAPAAGSPSSLGRVDPGGGDDGRRESRSRGAMLAVVLSMVSIFVVGLLRRRGGQKAS